MMLKIKNKLKKKIKEILCNRLYVHNFYQNINLDVCNKEQKKILICYIDIILNKNYNDIIKHTNFFEAFEIVKTFIDLNYCIDLCDCNDTYNISKTKEKSYDIIFGLGKAYELACNMHPNALKIVYLTESAPKVSYRNEKERINYYFKRHNRRIKILRSGLYYNENLIKVSDFGICIGNRYNSQFFYDLISADRIYLINPTALINKNYIVKTNKNFEVSKRNFLWFGSSGAIHKGLDILLDIFKENKNLKLYIAGLSDTEKWVISHYKDCKNIINLGFVDVQSLEFIEIMDKVAFVLLPSASEGMSTSVLTCMKHGLIPVVTANVGIDVDNIGIFLDDYKIEYVENKILELSNMDNSKIKELYNNLLLYVDDKFEVKYFKEDFNKIINSILTKINS